MCFNDGEAFTDLYFRMRYDDSINRTIKREDGKIVAALQVIPYPMTFCGSVTDTGYISGACTHPGYRNRGLMRRLMEDTLRQMRDEGIAFAALIPAEEWLHGYYDGSGFAGIFRRARGMFTADADFVATPGQGFTMNTGTEYREEEWRYLYRKLHERLSCLLHTRRDYEVILAALALEGGGVYTLRGRGEDITALAVIHPTASGMPQAGELVCDTEEHGALLLQEACMHLGVPSVGVVSAGAAHAASRVFGMARLVHAEKAFRLYAAAHPAESISFSLVDRQVPANNGHYRMCDGECRRESRRLSAGDPVWSVCRATEWLFASSAPCMSLMLD